MSENVRTTSTTNELARERNRAAADRTLMAWIRTSIAMIGFGFGVGKLSDVLEGKVAAMPEDPINSGIVFGEAFIALGIFSLLAAVVQYGRILKRIDNPQYIYTPSRALPMITAIALLAIGLFGFIAILL
jgi:putative membrane protein